MNKDLLKQALVLRNEIIGTLRNKLVFPKTLIELMQSREKQVSEEQLQDMEEAISDCLCLIDAKFIEYMDALKKESGDVLSYHIRKKELRQRP